MTPTALAKMAEIEGLLRDASERLTKIEQAPLPLWLQEAAGHAAPNMGAFSKAASPRAEGASPPTSDTAVLASLLADPVLGAAVRERIASLNPGRLP